MCFDKQDASGRCLSVSLDRILVETDVSYQKHCPMSVVGSPVATLFHVACVKVADWSAWCWQPHADLKSCKHQFHGLLWNWHRHHPSFRAVDWILGFSFKICDMRHLLSLWPLINSLWYVGWFGHRWSDIDGAVFVLSVLLVSVLVSEE